MWSWFTFSPSSRLWQVSFLKLESIFKQFLWGFWEWFSKLIMDDFSLWCLNPKACLGSENAWLFGVSGQFFRGEKLCSCETLISLKSCFQVFSCCRLSTQAGFFLFWLSCCNFCSKRFSFWCGFFRLYRAALLEVGVLSRWFIVCRLAAADQ